MPGQRARWITIAPPAERPRSPKWIRDRARTGSVQGRRQRRQLRRFEIVSAKHAARVEWRTGTASLKSLGPHREAIAVPVDQLHAIRALREEHVQMPVQRIEFELAAHDRRKAVDAFAAINRLRRDEDPDARGRAQHASTAFKRARSVATSTPASTRTTRPQRSSISTRVSRRWTTTS